MPDYFSQDMENYDTYWYSSEFWMGTPPQRRDLMVDMGSSWLWTWVDDCPSIDYSDTCTVTKDRFHKVLSSTFIQTEENKLIVYGKG